MTKPGPHRQPADDGAPPCRNRETERATEGDADGVMDALVSLSRVEKGMVTEDPNRPLADHERERILARYRHFQGSQSELPTCKRKSAAKIAGQIGEKPSTFSMVLADKYNGAEQKRDAILLKLDRWLTQCEASEGAPKRTGFCWTRVAEEIRAVANTTVLLQTIGTAYGPAGIGKTLTLEALLGMFPGSVRLTISDSTKTVTQFFSELASALKLEASGKRAYDRRRVCNHLRGTGRLLMFDEAHLAEAEVLNAVRQVHDECGVPVLLVGLPRMAQRIMEGRGDDSRGATLYSRIGISRDLTERCRSNGDPGEPLLSVDDVRRVFARSQLRIAPDAVDWLTDLSNMPEVGGLRAASNAVRLAIHVLNQSGESVREITVAMLLQAARMLKGVDAAKTIANRIQHRQRKTG